MGRVISLTSQYYKIQPTDTRETWNSYVELTKYKKVFDIEKEST
jgi:hypothetical protein